MRISDPAVSVAEVPEAFADRSLAAPDFARTSDPDPEAPSSATDIAQTQSSTDTQGTVFLTLLLRLSILCQVENNIVVSAD